MTDINDLFNDDAEDIDYDAAQEASENVSSGVTANEESAVKAPQLGKGIEVASGVATTILDAGTFGAARHVGGIMNMFAGIGGEGGDLIKRYHEGYGSVDEDFQKTRDKLPIGMNILAEFAGVAKGGPKLIDDAVSYMSRKFRPSDKKNIYF